MKSETVASHNASLTGKVEPAFLRGERIRAGVRPSDEELEDFCKFLEKHGFLDSDWWCEQPTAIERYREHQNKLRAR